MIAFGYVRTATADDEATVEALHDLVVSGGEREGYTVEKVFVDRQVPDDAVTRPGFAVLADNLTRTEGARVLVPSLDHLSPLPAVRTALLTKIGTLGGSVLSLAPSGTARTGHPLITATVPRRQAPPTRTGLSVSRREGGRKPV